MTLQNSLRMAALIATWCAAVLLALGSSTFDEDNEEEPPPITVNFDVSNRGDVRILDGITADTATSFTILGSFEKAANDRITLRQVPVLLNTGTAWAAGVLPDDPENLLVGDFVAQVTDTLEFGFDRQPAFGQFSSDLDGTTTIVTFSDTGDDVTIQTGTATAQTLSFRNFRDAADDTNRDVDLRMASKAYGLLENLWLVTRISETVHREIEQQLSMLQSIGLQTNLDLTCDNPMSMNAPTYVMRWLNDVADIGNAGNGDNFSAAWRNCLIDADGRWLESEMEIENFQLANDANPRSMSYTAEARILFFATQELEPLPSPAENQERVNGDIVVSASEELSVTPTQ
ncbi:MAG: hypothetical protein AAFN78_14045 [Pseudomonadota bacterium]